MVERLDTPAHAVKIRKQRPHFSPRPAPRADRFPHSAQQNGHGRALSLSVVKTRPESPLGGIHFALVPLPFIFIKMPAVDELLVRYRLHKQSLLQEPIELHAPHPCETAIKPERKLIEVVDEMDMTNRFLMLSPTTSVSGERRPDRREA